jgi:hypothetical protein
MIEKKIYTLLKIILIIGLFIFPFGILNTMVSLKYETDSPGDCISKVTGNNLCDSITNMKILFVICFASLVILLVYKNKIVKTDKI